MASHNFLRNRPSQNRLGFPDDFRHDVDRLFRRHTNPSGAVARGVFPPVNFHDTGDAYVLTAELPGIAPSDLEVSLHGSTVTLKGERRRPESVADASPHRLERDTGTFKRAFELPVSIDGDAAQAKHTNGVLVLTLPKAAEHRPRQISVQAD